MKSNKPHEDYPIQWLGANHLCSYVPYGVWGLNLGVSLSYYYWVPAADSLGHETDAGNVPATKLFIKFAWSKVEELPDITTEAGLKCGQSPQDERVENVPS